MKKFFYFLLFLVLLSLAFFLYWYFSAKGVVPKPPFFPDFPFPVSRNVPIKQGGDGTVGGGDTGGDGEVGTTVVINEEAALFEKEWADPVAGYAFSDFVTYGIDHNGAKKVATSSALFFVDRGTGHVYKKFVFTKKSVPTKISNTTFPGIYDAYFFDNNTEVLMRYLREADNTIVSITAKLPPLSSSVTLPLQNVVRLPENIVSVSVSPGGLLYFLVKTPSGSDLYTLKNGEQKRVRSYDLSELNLSFTGENLIVAQKPSAFEKTYFFPMDESDLYGGRTGQKAVFSSVSRGSFVSSLWTDQGLQLFSGDTLGGKTHLYTVATLADKCASSLLGKYFFCFVPNVIPLIPFGLPDDWYKGQVSFNDSLYVLDTVKYEENKLSRLETDTGEEMDIAKPIMSKRDLYIAFTNRLTNELWAGNITNLLQR